jgi:hypothetical protein
LKDRQYNGQKKKTNNELQNITHTTIDRETQTQGDLGEEVAFNTCGFILPPSPSDTNLFLPLKF